jgi:hypothetical protein
MDPLAPFGSFVSDLWRTVARDLGATPTSIGPRYVRRTGARRGSDHKQTGPHQLLLRPVVTRLGVEPVPGERSVSATLTQRRIV